MNRRPFFIGLTAILAVTASAFALQVLTDPEHVRPDHVERPTAGASAPLTLAAVGGESDRAATGPIVEWIEGHQRAEQERIAAEEAARMAATRSVAGQSVARPGTGPATCDGINWAIPVGLVIRESGCNFDAQSPGSYCGGYGCVGAYQFDARHWDAASGWGGCADLGDWHDPDAQHECARRLSRDSTNLAPWGG